MKEHANIAPLTQDDSRLAAVAAAVAIMNQHGADLHGSLKEASAGLRRLPADLAQALGAADIHAAAREGLE